ncbi:MAG: hypothetical protein WCE75_06275 [Terracidiphilus sp.]
MESFQAAVEAKPGTGFAGRSQVHPRLKKLVGEASEALARLDAGRLEELALCCQALNRDLAPGDEATRRRLAGEAHEALDAMEVFARVLEATRANLRVMERLRELRQGSLEYTEPRASGWQPAGSRYGDH